MGVNDFFPIFSTKKRSQVVTTTPTPTSRVLRAVSMAPWARPWRSSSLRWPWYEKLDHRAFASGGRHIHGLRPRGETHIHWKIPSKIWAWGTRGSMIFIDIHVPGMNWYSVHPPPRKKSKIHQSSNPSITNHPHWKLLKFSPHLTPHLGFQQLCLRTAVVSYTTAIGHHLFFCCHTGIRFSVGFLD